MKRSIFVIASVSCVINYACHSSRNLSATEFDRESLDGRGSLMLIGKSSKSRLQKEPFGSWFNKNYLDYNIDTTVAEQLKTKLKNKRFLIFMGTWCGDSRAEVPKIYKLLEYCGVPESNIQLVNLSFHDSVYKQSPTHEEQGLGIHRVPDLLIFDSRKEIGRIVERPIRSWEQDLLSILHRENYQSRYQLVHWLQQTLNNEKIEELEQRIEQVADSLKPVVTKNEGLQSYGNVLLATNEKRKALLVLRLNTLLYPSGTSGFMALADAYLKAGDNARARENYQRVIAMEPSNQKAMSMLAQLMK